MIKIWLEFGSYGTGIDAAGKVGVGPPGNNRIVRFDDMGATNWSASGAAGKGRIY